MIETISRGIFVESWHFLVGGSLIGILVPLLYYFYNTGLGVSTGYGNIVKILLRTSQLRWIKEKFPNPWNWRLFFMIGIVFGGFLSARVSGASIVTMEMGIFTQRSGLPTIFSAVYFFIGGSMLGLGARIAGGCTSGHSIHGIANLHKSSIVVTILFLLGGAIAANVLRIFLLGGGAS
ncbi:MAG: YeeE/YedE family protein [Firmicutes bacterium]|nr:YeeE/YedE family protein [Bacillota bacterium]